MSTPTYDKLAGWESAFRTAPEVDGRRYTLQPVTLQSRDGTDSLEVLRCRRADGGTAYFRDQSIEKSRVCLHFTVGNLRGDIYTLTGDSRLSVAFVVARDGTIYELFDHRAWSYHLGPSDRYDNTAMSAVSVGIELSNYGPLTPKGDVLEHAYGSTYCTLAQTEAYVELDEPFRGHRYFASYTASQLDAVARLVRFLCVDLSLPPKLLSEDERFGLLEDLSPHGVGTEFMGACSHANFRTDKWDIGPAFDWAGLQEALEDGPLSFGGRDAEAHLTARERLALSELPEADDAAAADVDPHHRHVVHAGDTLESCARRYGTTVAALRARNDLPDDAVLHEGQVLWLPR